MPDTTGHDTADVAGAAPASRLASVALRWRLAQEAPRAKDQHQNEDGEDHGARPGRRDVLIAEGRRENRWHSPPARRPGRLPMPPSTAAVKAFRPTSKPIR